MHSSLHWLTGAAFLISLSLSKTVFTSMSLNFSWDSSDIISGLGLRLNTLSKCCTTSKPLLHIYKKLSVLVNEIRRMFRNYGYIVLVTVIGISTLATLLSAIVVVSCVDMMMHLGYHNCTWEVLTIFVISLIVLIPTTILGVFLLRRTSNLDRALIISVSGIMTCLFLEYVGLTGFGNMSTVFALALGYVLSGRGRWKVTWEPSKQCLVLFLVVISVISVYTVAPNYLPHSLPIINNGFSELLVPLLFRFGGEISIVIAAMYFGKGALKYISAVTS